MNQVSIWNKALSQAEVTEVYNSGIPADLDNHSAAADVLSWWFLSDPTNFPLELDFADAINGTLNNMETGDYIADIPT
jgi:hypothetical protein